METKTFTYGGYTFEPRGQFKDYGIKPGKNEMRQICRALHYPNSGNVADGEVKFNYDEFYKAAGDGCDADVFFCKETGEQYVPCASVLCIFDQTSSSEEVRKRYETRQQTLHAAEMFRKEEELRNATCLSEEQHKAFGQLLRAAKKCKDAGLEFCYDGNDVRLLRTDWLKDLTNNMAPMSGQTQIPDECFLTIAEDVWNATEGLYANPKV